jgi:hypothetical protein
MIDFGPSAKSIVAIALCALCSLLPAQVLAANSEAQHPQISIETKYIKVSVTVDIALKPFPELFASCFSEGKVWFNKKNSDAAAEWRDNRKAFRDLQWFYERDYALRSVVGRYISVMRGILGSMAALIQTSMSTLLCGTTSRENAPMFVRSSAKLPITAQP